MMKNVRSSKGLALVLTAIIIFITGFSSYLYFTIKSYDELIFPGVIVGGVDLSGKTKNQALDLLKQKNKSSISENKIIIKTKEKSYTLGYSDIQLENDINDVLNKVYSYGRNENIIKRFFIIKSDNIKKFDLHLTYNEKPIKDLISKVEQDVNKEPKNASIENSGTGNLSVIAEVQGERLLSSELEKEIKDKINKNNGESFSVEAPIEIIKPKVSKEKLKTVDTLIASFSTSYRSSSYERATNIKIATASINGTVIMPGEVFSFNDVVGRRTAEKGYKSAGVIVGNKLDSGLGGGVCQVSSTLYNAVLSTGLTSTERAHHSFPSSYVKYGMDATVDYGNIDYKFKNSFDYPIYIEAYSGGRVVQFNIYSNKAVKNRTYSMENEIYETIEAGIEYQDDTNLEEGKTEQIQPAHTGYKVKVYRNIYENGNLINKELISDDFYKPVNGIIKKGTKKPEIKEVDTKKVNEKENNKDSNKNASETNNTTNNNNPKPKDEKKTNNQNNSQNNSQNN